MKECNLFGISGWGRTEGGVQRGSCFRIMWRGECYISATGKGGKKASRQFFIALVIVGWEKSCHWMSGSETTSELSFKGLDQSISFPAAAIQLFSHLAPLYMPAVHPAPSHLAESRHLISPFWSLPWHSCPWHAYLKDIDSKSQK